MISFLFVTDILYRYNINSVTIDNCPLCILPRNAVYEIPMEYVLDALSIDMDIESEFYFVNAFGVS